MISRTWAVLTTDAVQAWWASLDDKGQRVLVRGQALLAVHGVHLGRAPCRGDKTGDAQFYRRLIPVADRLYDEHVRDLKREGLI